MLIVAAQDICLVYILLSNALTWGMCFAGTIWGLLWECHMCVCVCVYICTYVYVGICVQILWYGLQSFAGVVCIECMIYLFAIWEMLCFNQYCISV